VRTPEMRLARWLDLLGELLRQPLVELPIDAINAELLATFDAHGAALHCRAPDGVHSLRAWPVDLCETRVEGLRAAADTQPIARWYRTTRSPAPHTSGRVPRAIADERCVQAWVEVSRPYGVTELLCLPLHVAADEHRIFVAGRPDRDFSDADLELARLVQPVLIGLDRQVTQLLRWRSRDDRALADAVRRAAVDETRLTGRELAVLELLAESLSATAISRRLGIGVRTVNTHLENLYRKLGTRDRLATVLRAQRCGLLVGQGPVA
jgi:DNA-binding CsgD family transcriptional regulator